MEDRYQRQVQLDEIGSLGQEKLRSSHVLVVGAGGLGCPALLYLVAAGVGQISLIDNDTISETNLNRQVLYNASEIGCLKVEIAKKKLLEQNPLIKINAISKELNLGNAEELVQNVDVALDCTDNMATRYLLSDVCELHNAKLIYAGIHRFQGQLTVLHGIEKISYRDLFPYDSDKIAPNSCDENGVLGIVPGIMGTLQANEAIKIIAGFGDVLDGKMMILNLLNLQSQLFSIKQEKREKIKVIESKPEYEHLCLTGISKCISVDNFLSMDYQNMALVDIRSESEIPKSNLKVTSENQIKNKDIVLLCQTGKRTKAVLYEWSVKYPNKKVYSLDGGVEALNRTVK